MSLSRRLPRAICLALAALSFVTGCAQQSTETPPIEGVVSAGGTITLDGKPLEGASVTFIPTGPAQPNQAVAGAFAITGPDGKYSLISGASSPGALPGTYRVVVSRMLKPDGSVAHFTAEVSPEMLRSQGAKESIADEESNPTSSTLQATVPPAGSTALDFEVHAAE